MCALPGESGLSQVILFMVYTPASPARLFAKATRQRWAQARVVLGCSCGWRQSWGVPEKAAPRRASDGQHTRGPGTRRARAQSGLIVLNTSR